MNIKNAGLSGLLSAVFIAVLDYLTKNGLPF